MIHSGQQIVRIPIFEQVEKGSAKSTEQEARSAWASLNKAVSKLLTKSKAT
ncbi:MAG: hypothetical protein HYX77_08120 [Acidobacteria bacterium]|nr:hypothetical protein [Acidobacteriota bacterium]